PENRAAERQQQTLDQELTYQPPPRSAQRRADRHLLLTGCGARQKHVGDIAASDEQQKRNRRRDGVQGLAKLAYQAVDPAYGLDAEVLRIVARITLRQPPQDDLRIGLRLLDADAWLELGLKIPVIAARLSVGAIHGLGHPDIGAELGEAHGHDADERHR